MSWDYRCDENGNLEIIVSRWYYGEKHNKPRREITVVATGFEPNEPVQVEVCGEEH